ncbi:MAG: hypothetical protein ACW9W4_03875 [Candidatus Nitrosopumilus sp. bin_7KS]
MPLIPDVINERKLWVIISTRKNNDSVNELDIVKPMVEELNGQWSGKGDFMWSGRFDDNKTSMIIFEATEEKAKKYFEDYSKVCSDSLDVNIHQWDALPLFTILERIQGKI